MDVVVLCYHALSETWPLNLAIRPRDFEQQIEWVLEAGYTPATFADAVLAPPAEKTFSVTFDDGWTSVKTLAWPILQQLGVPATVFVSTDLTDRPHVRRSGQVLDPFVGTEHEHELHTLGWDELVELDADGWEVASHCVLHPLLTTLDDERLRYELTESRARLAEFFGKECRTIAYPSGDHDARVVRFTGEAGYSAAGTLPTVFPRVPDPLAYPRVSVGRDDSMLSFRLKFSRASRYLRSTRFAETGVAGFRRTRDLMRSAQRLRPGSRTA